MKVIENFYKNGKNEKLKNIQFFVISRDAYKKIGIDINKKVAHTINL